MTVEYAGLVKEYQGAKRELPYGGTDTRIFLTKPHLSVAEKPLDPASQIMFLETYRGVYYRISRDRSDNMHIQVHLEDIAVVLTKTRQPPSLTRGIRGSAGSGRGVRTLIEYFSASISYRNHIQHSLTGASGRHIDLNVNIIPTSVLLSQMIDPLSPYELPYSARLTARHEPTKSKYTDITPDLLIMSAHPIPMPSCVFPLLDSHVNNTSNDTCDVVTSFEDLLFVYHMVQSFLATTAEAPSPSEANGNKTNRPAPRVRRANSVIISSERPDNLIKTSRMKDTSSINFDSNNAPAKSQTNSPTFYGIIALQGFKFVIVDNLLGLHLPLLQVSFMCIYPY